MAAAKSVLTEICTAEAWAKAKAENERLLAACQSVLDDAASRRTPWPGGQGLHHLPPERVRNYRDYKETDFELAYAHWIYMMSHGIFLPPGLDEQWLISVQHTPADIDRHAEVFAAFIKELVA